MNLPPSTRSNAAAGLTAAASAGGFELQVCVACNAVQYPPREACHVCLGTDLHWRSQDGSGELLAVTRIHVSHNPYFKERLPWPVALVRLDCGPTVMAHLHVDCAPPPARVRVQAWVDVSGQGVLIARPPEGTPDISRDPRLVELTTPQSAL
jgi:uncharacterized OB-fold protein